MSGTTPVRQHSAMQTDVADSPLGILAALATPPVVTTTSKHPHESEMSSVMHIESRRGSFGTHSGSPSPPNSPSTRAAMRLGQKTPRPHLAHTISEGSCTQEAESDELTAAVAPNTSDQGTALPTSIASAIPATQLDVLALVTATSPPLPGRRRWMAHSTPKPTFTRSALSQNVTPARMLARADGAEDSGSETISEDEETLRSHSTIMRSRYHNASLRPLPATPRGLPAYMSMQQSATPAMSASDRIPRYHPVYYTGESGRRPMPMSATTQRTGRHCYKHSQGMGVNRWQQMSNGESSDEDREPSLMPVMTTSRRNITPTFQMRELNEPPKPPTSAERRTYRTPMHPSVRNLRMSSRQSIPQMGTFSEHPATEPVMRRRLGRRRSHLQIRGSNHANTLSGMSGDSMDDDDSDGGGDDGDDDEHSHRSLLSMSPSFRRQSMQMRRTNQYHKVNRGSATGDGVENGDRQPEAHYRNTPSEEAMEGADTQFFATRPYSSVRRPIHSPMDQNRARQPIFASPGDRSPIKVRYFEIRKPPNTGGDEYDGSTTETDDELFSRSLHAVHASICPPRRTVRHLETLRSQNPAPAHYHPMQNQRPSLPGHNRTGSMGSASPLAPHTAQSPRRAAMQGAGNADNRQSPGRMPQRIHWSQHQPSVVVQSRFEIRPPENSGRSAEASRKRALTAPSLLESPLAKRPGYIVTEPTLHSSDEESTSPQSPLGSRPSMVRQVSMLGVSPVSSLRSSLVNTREPRQPQLIYTSSAIHQHRDEPHAFGDSSSPSLRHAQATRNGSSNSANSKSATPSTPPLPAPSVSGDALFPPITPGDK